MTLRVSTQDHPRGRLLRGRVQAVQSRGLQQHHPIHHGHRQSHEQPQDRVQRPCTGGKTLAHTHTRAHTHTYTRAHTHIHAEAVDVAQTALSTCAFTHSSVAAGPSQTVHHIPVPSPPRERTSRREGRVRVLNAHRCFSINLWID